MESSVHTNLCENAMRAGLDFIVDIDVNYSEVEGENNEDFMLDGVLSLLSAMSDIDPLFRELRKDVVGAGSFYEDLRITKADEFDMQIVLELPFPKDSFETAHADSTFVTYQLKESPQETLIKHDKWRYPNNEVLKFFDDEHFLLADKALTWFQNLIEEALESDKFIMPKSVYKMRRKPQSQSCPAYTMQITGEKFYNTIDVDIVPVICTCCSKMPSEMHQSERFLNLLQKQTCIQWFLVPKPPKDRFATDPQAHELWRSAFPQVEKWLLHDTGILKKMIKLFKLLRDRNNCWRKSIVSYYIKTFCLLKFDSNPDLSYWSEENIGKAFMEMLEAFQDAMNKHFIPYYFNPKANLLSSVSVETAKNISNRIQDMLNLIRADPAKISSIFLIPPEDTLKVLSRNSSEDDLENYMRIKTYYAKPEVSCLDTLGGCCIS